MDCELLILLFYSLGSPADCTFDYHGLAWGEVRGKVKERGGGAERSLRSDNYTRELLLLTTGMLSLRGMIFGDALMVVMMMVMVVDDGKDGGSVGLGVGGWGLRCGHGNDLYGGSGWTGFVTNSRELNYHESATCFAFGLPFEVGGQMGRFLLMGE